MSKKRGNLFKKVFSIVVAGATALLLCICPISANLEAECAVVSADSVSNPNYSFHGSLFLCPVSSSVNSPVSWLGGAAFDLTSSSYSISFLSSNLTRYTVGSGSLDIAPDLDIWSAQHLYCNYDSNYYNILLRKGSSFTANVVGVTISMINSSSWVDQLGTHNKNNSITVFRYFGKDTNDWVEIGLVSYLANFYFGYAEFDARTYYFVQEHSEGYLGGYNAGYSAGESVGVEQGYIQGYEKGDKIGYNQGYSVGYNAGVNESNAYSFSNLIGSVIDVPVQAFMGLFNFELLGVNLAGFFTGLLTLAFIICIVRLILP